MAFAVEIVCNDDGTYTVSGEDESAEDSAPEGADADAGADADDATAAPGAAPAPDADAGAPPSSDMDDESDEGSEGQTVKTVKEALTIALDMLRSKSSMAGKAADKDFDAGFGAQAGS